MLYITRNPEVGSLWWVQQTQTAIMFSSFSVFPLKQPCCLDLLDLLDSYLFPHGNCE